MSGKLQIAEVFHSLQGEGTWVGTPMLFVRLAGCNVGRPASTVQRRSNSFNLQLPVLQNGKTAMACATYDGRSFWCDTDYDKKQELTVTEVFKECWEKHLCLTGGEPFLHSQHFVEIAEEAAKREIKIHVETSGTLVREIPEAFWITCAPKIACTIEIYNRANEIKLLVDARFHPDDLPVAVIQHPNVFLCPINDMTEVKRDNFDKAYSWLKLYPHWKISWQAHKDWGYR